MKTLHSGVIALAVDILRSGGVIVYPTETVYGIGCDPWNADAVSRVFRMKGRDSGKAPLLLVDSRAMAEEAAGPFSGTASRLADIFWPGPLTIVVRPLRDFPPCLLGPSGGAAFRATTHPLCREIIAGFGRPIVSTSANRSGDPPVSGYDEAVRMFGETADLVIENGGDMIGTPSTVVDTTTGDAVLIREGAVPFHRIMEIPGR